MATSYEYSLPDKEMFYQFTWKIENITLYKGEMDTDLLSPSFKIGTLTKHTEFQMYLNSGDWSTRKIHVHILGSALNMPGDKFKSELTLLSANGVIMESHSTSLYLDYSCGWCVFPKPTMFSNEKVLLMFLPQNAITICWKVYSLGSGECFFRTVFHQKILRWNIRDFSKRPDFNNSLQLSSLYLTIHLSKLEQKRFMKIIMIKFLPSNQDKLHFGNCTITTVEKTVEKDIIYRYGEVNELHKKRMFPSWEAYIMLDEGACKLIKNDTLILQWEFTVGVGEIWNGNETKAIHKVTTCQTKMSSSTLRSDLLRLYEDKKFCDATLRTRNASFPVHKSVLCARSPVFCAMFESDTKESRTGVVHIPDIGTDTLERMLLFLYKDTLGDIHWKMAAGLYYAADKYRIQALKEECVSVLIEKLSVDNACDALVLADTHQDENLMQAVKDFVFNHDKVVCSVQWKKLETKKPSLAIQFLRDMYLMKKK